MFRFANYIFGTEVEPNVNNENLNHCTEEDIDDDWILIDVHFDDNYKPNNTNENCFDLQTIAANYETTTNRVPQNHLDAQTQHSIEGLMGPDVPNSPSPTQCQGMEESWFVTPPPCFNSVSNHIIIETTPLENLLIEHPSMSVFGPSLPPIDHHSPHSGSSLSTPSDMSSNDSTLALTQTMSRRQMRQIIRQQQHNSAQNRNNNQTNVNLHIRNAVLDELHVLSSMQSQEVSKLKKYLTKSSLDRQNKVLVQRNNTPQTRRSKMAVRPNGISNNRKNC